MDAVGMLFVALLFAAFLLLPVALVSFSAAKLVEVRVSQTSRRRAEHDELEHMLREWLTTRNRR